MYAVIREQKDETVPVRRSASGYESTLRIALDRSALGLVDGRLRGAWAWRCSSRRRSASVISRCRRPAPWIDLGRKRRRSILATSPTCFHWARQRGQCEDSTHLRAQSIALLATGALARGHGAELVGRARLPDAQIAVVRAGEDEARVERECRREDAAPISPRSRWVRRTAACAWCGRRRGSIPATPSRAGRYGRTSR